MDVVGLALILGGVAAIAIGALRARGPLSMIRYLDATDANIRRYEEWRGKRDSIETDGPTGASVMRAHMRQRLLLWGMVVAAGAVAAFVGLLLI